MSSNRAVLPKAMPWRSDRSAPRFDGKPASLSIFLDEVERLAEHCSISSRQTIQWANRYSEDRELWEMLDAVKLGDWEKFKEELYDLYPGSTPQYLVADLTALVEKQAVSIIRNEEDFGVYKRSFMTIAAFLKDKSRLSDREIGLYFMQGLDIYIKTKVQEQLKAENPRRHPDDPYSVSEISSAVLFVLSCSYVAKPKERHSSMPSIKNGHLDESDIDSKFLSSNVNISDLVSEIVKQLDLQSVMQPKRVPKQPIRVDEPRSRYCTPIENRASTKEAMQKMPERPNTLSSGKMSSISPCVMKEETDARDTKPRQEISAGSFRYKEDTRLTKQETTDEFTWIKKNIDDKPILSKGAVKEVLILENLATSTQKEAADERPVASRGEVEEAESLAPSTQKKADEEKKKMNNQPKNPDPSGHERRIECNTTMEEPIFAKDVVQTAMTAENPIHKQGVSTNSQKLERRDDTTYQNHQTMSQSEDFADQKTIEKASVEPVVQRKTANCAEPQSKYNTPVEETMSVEDMMLEMPSVLSTQESPSVSPYDCRNVEDFVTMKQILQKDQAATAAVIEIRKEGEEAEIIMAEATRGNDRSNIARNVEDGSYESIRPFYITNQATHLKFPGQNSCFALEPNIHPILAHPTRIREDLNARMIRRTLFPDVDNPLRRRNNSMGLQTSEGNTDIRKQSCLPIFRSSDFEDYKSKHKANVRSCVCKEIRTRTEPVNLKTTLPEECLEEKKMVCDRSHTIAGLPVITAKPREITPETRNTLETKEMSVNDIGYLVPHLARARQAAFVRTEEKDVTNHAYSFCQQMMPSKTADRNNPAGISHQTRPRIITPKKLIIPTDVSTLNLCRSSACAFNKKLNKFLKIPFR